MSDLGRWFRDTPESRRLLAEEIALLEEPDMPSPCCGRGGFLHHIEDDE